MATECRPGALAVMVGSGAQRPGGEKVHLVVSTGKRASL